MASVSIATRTKVTVGKIRLGFIVIGSACLMFSSRLDATTIQTLGAGSAVTSTDRSATFDAITSSGIALSDYVEGKLFIGANADSLVGFDPFGGANSSDPHFYALDGGSMGGGVDSWVTITTTDSVKMFGVEFLYGNSWTGGGGSPWGNNNAWVTWETLNGPVVMSSGQIGPNPMLPVGTVVGFYDPDGFDRLLVKCNVANQADPNIQALALDNLKVQLTTAVPTATETPTMTATATSSATQPLSPSATPTPVPCVGDCNGKSGVTVDEILTMVNIALGNTAVTACQAGDARRDGLITVDEILLAVNNALNGCVRPV